jgi:hypothetical protein
MVEQYVIETMISTIVFLYSQVSLNTIILKPWRMFYNILFLFYFINTHMMLDIFYWIIIYFESKYGHV